MNRYILGLVLLFSTSLAFAQATDDNEINIDQEGDTLTLYIDQYGYGNKLGLDDFSSRRRHTRFLYVSWARRCV